MPRIVDSRCVLAVRDLKASTQFYMDVLGFRRDFGDGSDGWSFLSRDNFKVRLGECPDQKPASELGDHSYFVYLTVEGLDQLHQELSARGAPVISEPEDQPWGVREFSIRTPDGHRIRFGERIPAREQRD
jgi:catechol 2,3-dioxygenase-like lactoylglutathione lyase family enzyme